MTEVVPVGRRPAIIAAESRVPQDLVEIAKEVALEESAGAQRRRGKARERRFTDRGRLRACSLCP